MTREETKVVILSIFFSKGILSYTVEFNTEFLLDIVH